ncbi:cofilin [Modicella reniformis]|uniref:Cofilin n=1 Tax=Modicella reniformis TaxID=1440133 RepID=A0A9P6SQ06_9FUNG|nr:cofilin [Modicella reniformis]
MSSKEIRANGSQRFVVPKRHQMKASSGVQVAPDCLETYQSLKTQKQLKYIIFKITDDKKSIVLDKTGVDDKSLDSVKKYEAFVNELPQNDCRLAVYDFDYILEDDATKTQGQRNKIVFFFWAPDDGASIKAKMLYASSKDALRKTLVGAGPDVQGNDLAGVAYESVLDKIMRSK